MEFPLPVSYGSDSLLCDDQEVDDQTALCSCWFITERLCLIALYFSQWQHKTVDSTAPKAASVKFEELSEQTCWINVDLSSNILKSLKQIFF